MKLKTLLKDLPITMVKGSQSITINGICSNSKKVKPGDLFIARKGKTFDGSEFIPGAILAGAVAVVTDLFNPFYDNIVQIIVEDVNAIEAKMAARFYKYPSKNLLTIGITGTNGKTTASFLIKYLFEKVVGATGYIGTIGTFIQEKYFPSSLTTPEAVTLQNLLYEMQTRQCKAAVMEVSSHAIDQGRIDEIDFDICIFTNLSQDHLDYHQTMEQYAQAKGKLFEKQPLFHQKAQTQFAILNRDDAYYDFFAKKTQVDRISFGIESEADVRAKNIALSPAQTKFDLEYQNQSVAITTNLIGRFNVLNLLCAAAAGIAKKIPLHVIGDILSQTIDVPGRMQRVENTLNLDIFVDFAHTPDGLEKALHAAKEITRGKLWIVFGCGGNRDRLKRPKMLEIASSLADQVVVTSDNPRFEDPLTIVGEMIAGKDYANAIVEIDRKQAIEKAITSAEEGDFILIAGKGHEKEQIFQNMTLEFDDYLVAKQICLDYLSKLLVKK